mgnify:FL=1
MKKITKHKYIILIFLVTLIIFLNLFINPRYYGHDTIFHTANIIELSKTINIKNILGNNIISLKSNPFGYGTWLFYPKLPHLLGAYLYKIFDIYTSMKIVYFIITFLSAITIYVLSKKIFNTKKIAFLSSIIYITIPYHICEIYIRDAFAENFMFLAVPLIFLGLYNLLDNDYKKFYIYFILGYVIGMYSHLVSMVFCTIFVALFILYHHKYFFSKEKIKSLFISTIIVIGLTLPFLTTVIEYKLLNEYTVFLSDSFTNRATLIYRSISFKDLFMGKPIYDDIMPYFNIMTIILTLITTIQLILNKTKYKSKLLPMLLYIILLINLVCSKLIWNNIPEIFLMLQFPWRLLVFMSVFISLYAPVCLLTDLKINIPKIFNKIIYSMIICLVLIEGVNNIKYYSNEEYTEDYVLSSKLAMGYQQEYLPLKTNNARYFRTTYLEKRKMEIVSDNNTKISIISSSFPNLKFEVKKLKEKTKIEIPRIYYLDYILKDKDGNKVKLTMSKYGMLEADIIKEGKYELYHKNTLIETISNIIGVATLIFVIYKLVGWRRWKANP